MAKELEKAHLYYDGINMIRVLDGPVLKQSNELLESCTEYTNNLEELVQIVDSLLATQDELVANVERRKMAAIGLTNQLKSIAREGDSQRSKLQTEISEKSMVLEQLEAEFDSLQLVEATQQETMQYLTHMK